nr:unnamed protein product [Callosobruchus chinensis]
MYFKTEDNIIKTENLEFDASQLGGVGKVAFQCMKKHGKNPAQILAETGEVDTFESLLQRCIRIALALRKKGIKKGDIVTGCSNNHLDACTHMIASFFIGALPCSLDPTLSPFEFKQLIAQVKPKIIFTVLESLENIRESLREANLEAEIVVFGDAECCTSFGNLIQPQEDESTFEPIHIDNAEETAIIYFSSGTSGFPKGVCLNHYYFYHHSPLVPPSPNSDLDEDRRNYEMSIRKMGTCFLNYGSMYWGSAGQGVFLSVVTGMCRLLCSNFDPKQFWEIVDKFKVSGTLLTPFQVTQLVKTGKPENANPKCLLRIVTGGSPLANKYFFALQDMLPNTDILQTYGQTEVGVLAAFQLHNKSQRERYMMHPDTVGVPIRGVWYKVVDPETDQILGPNQEGELRVKSKTVMNGYYNRSCANRYDKDGWFRTGDVVRYDDNLYFYVVDRLKEMLKYRGWHIPQLS